MKRETLYLDTSVPSSYYDDKVEERRRATVKFWREVLPNYHVHISEITLEEIEATRVENIRRNLKKLIRGFKILRPNERINDLAGAYIEARIFPPKYFNDALHVATASYYQISYLVSWNYQHLVKVRTRRMVNSVNISKGFCEIEIVSPQEL